jgi:hypothetical protein
MIEELESSRLLDGLQRVDCLREIIPP